jgi:tRNA1Val (adenine37-N6)-methyltransferase
MVQTKKMVIKPFTFKQFSIEQDQCAMKVGTDGVLLGAWSDIGGAKKILDIGTGTGIIAIMLAQKTLNIKGGGVVHAVEIDEAAYFQARLNMEKTPFSERLSVFLDSIQDYSKKTTCKYNLIVSNPPFFTGGTFSSNQDKNNVRHTVKLPHGDLLHATRQMLTPDGKFCVILPLIEGLRFIEIARNYGFHCTKKTEVYTLAGKAVERLLLQFELTEQPLIKDQLVIQNSDERNDYTEDYKRLTKDFYTIF